MSGSNGTLVANRPRQLYDINPDAVVVPVSI